VLGLFGSPDSNSGSLYGRAARVTRYNNFRLNTQTLTANNTNTNGTTVRLASAMRDSNSWVASAMRDSSSPTDWDFYDIWAIEPDRNNGFPFPQIFAPNLPPGATSHIVSVTDYFAITAGSGSSFTVEVDMPLSSLDNVRVNGTALTRDTHFTASSGSTVITLLPNFLDTLDKDFHTLTITFDDGTFAEEQFLIISGYGESETPPLYRLYLNDTLIYSANDGGLQVDDNSLGVLRDNLQSYRVEFEDGRVSKSNSMYLDSPSTILASL